MRRLVVALSLVGCTRSSEPVTVKADPSASTLPTKPEITPPRPDVTRVKGAIDGRFSLRSARVVVGEPIVATLDVRSTHGPIEIFVGGDQRNEAAYPMRFALKVTDAAGAVVCDDVEKPAVPSFGGIGSEQTFKEGDTFTESAVLNAMCPALATPGDYRVTLHRRLAPMSMTITKPGSTVPLSCDIHPVHEGPLPKGYEPGCAAQMDALPSVTSELSLHVDPFDAAKLRTAVTALLGAKPDVTQSRVVVWICGWLACSCPKTPTDADVLAALPKSLPSHFPLSCRAAAP